MIAETAEKIQKIRIEENKKLLTNINKLFTDSGKTKNSFKQFTVERYSDVYLTKVFAGSREITDEFLDLICEFFNVDRDKVIAG